LKELTKVLNGVKDIPDLLQNNKVFSVKPGQSFDDYFDEQDEKKVDDGGNTFMMAYRLTGLSKVDGVCDFIENLAENGAKFLVFAHHMVMLDGLQKFAEKSKIGFVRIDGKVNPELRHERVK
jgi:SNF2 family DNA or RNA helicase